jgi:hypothetical protein
MMSVLYLSLGCEVSLLAVIEVKLIVIANDGVTIHPGCGNDCSVIHTHAHGRRRTFMHT